MAPKEALIALPISVVSPVDLGRLLRELEAIDNVLNEAALRKETAKLPKTSKLLDDLIGLNKADLAQATHRSALTKQLQDIQHRAPVLHISFSADPSTLFTEKLMGWLRTNIHQQVLLTVGLQPSIGAGCLVRTTNKFFDCTLREDFLQKSDVLMAALKAATQPQQPVASEAAPVPAQVVAA